MPMFYMLPIVKTKKEQFSNLSSNHERAGEHGISRESWQTFEQGSSFGI